MADNPFEDPDVRAAAANDNGLPPPVPPNVYGADGAYDDGPSANVNADMIKAAAAFVPPEQQKQIAMSAGSAIANQAANKAQEEYKASQATQADQHAAPEAPTFCVQLFNWFPLRLFSFVSGLTLIVGPPLDMAFGKPTPITFFIYIYLMIFGIITVAVEAPTWKLTRGIQLKIFFWFRLLSRMWGRAWFYLFVSILCYAPQGSEDTTGGTFSLVAGIMITLTAIFCFIFSRMSAKKFQRMREFVAAGSESDEMEGRFMRKFDELDLGGEPGTIGSLEIVKLAEQAGRTLSNSERHVIQTFLDDSCNGYVSKEDWMKQFVTQYQEKGFKQNYL